MHCWCKCAAVSWEDAGGLAAADGAGAGAEAAAPLFLASQVGFGARTEWLPSPQTVRGVRVSSGVATGPFISTLHVSVSLVYRRAMTHP